MCTGSPEGWVLIMASTRGTVKPVLTPGRSLQALAGGLETCKPLWVVTEVSARRQRACFSSFELPEDDTASF